MASRINSLPVITEGIGAQGINKQYSSHAYKLKALEGLFAKADIGRNGRLSLLARELGKQLKPRRSWTDKALYRVLAGHKPGRFLAVAIDRLYSSRHPRVRKDKPRVYVPLNSREEVAQINRIPAGVRREILLAAAEKG